MSRRQLLAFVVFAYLTADLTTPALPGVFSFDGDDVFIETALDPGGRLVRLHGDISPPRDVTVSNDHVVTPLVIAPPQTIAVDSSTRGEPHRRLAARSALVPLSFDDH